MNWSRVAVVAAGGAAALVLAACGSSSSTAGSGSTSGTTGGPLAGQTITLYNGQHEQTTDALVKAFEAKTGVTVKVRNDDEDVLAQQIQQEGSRSPADVFFTENSPPLARLDEAGLLAPVTPSTLAHVPTADNASSGDWVGVSARVSELVYNTDDLTPSQLPKSVLDLADPKWKGKLDIAPSETDFAPIVTSVAQDKGDSAAVAWLKGLKANAGCHVDPDNETLVANVNKGVTEIGVINHYYWYRLRAEVGPSRDALRAGDLRQRRRRLPARRVGGGVLKSSRHQAAAQALVAFMVSQAGQQVLDHERQLGVPDRLRV